MSSSGKTIRVSEQTYRELAKQGNLEDSFDSVIQKLINSQKSEVQPKN
jgi:predicted CopG family antitoxin